MFKWLFISCFKLWNEQLTEDWTVGICEENSPNVGNTQLCVVTQNPVSFPSYSAQYFT
jgi:hypothetical protein